MAIRFHRPCILSAAMALAAPAWIHAEAPPNLTVIAVVGAEGAEEYGDQFREWTGTLRAACEKGAARFEAIGLQGGGEDDARQLRERLEKEVAAGPDGGALWLFLIGHGTFDGRTAKFNVRGPDFSDQDLADWLRGFKRPLAVINTAPASAPFLKSLSGPGRVIVTATKGANEIFFTRFGEYFISAIGGLGRADLDHDDQVSILEAFLHAAEQVKNFYESEGRLATEHALIDDNGDGLGTRPDWFEGVRAVKNAKQEAEPDGERALQFVLAPNADEARMPLELRTRRDALELKVAALRRKKSQMPEAEYYAELESLLVEIARIYERAEKAPAGREDGGKSS